MSGKQREQDVTGKDVPYEDPKTRQQGEENRKEMDEVPPHGTDPLHEGP